MNRSFFRIFLFVIIVFGPLTVVAQESDVWLLHTQQDGVKFYYQVIGSVNENNDQFFKIKVENTTNTDLDISWDLHLWYNGQCRNCNFTSQNGVNMYNYSISVKSRQERIIDFSLKPKGGLKIFYKRKNSILTQFEFANLLINTAN